MWREGVNYMRGRWASWLFIAVLAVVAVMSARVALQSKPAQVGSATEVPLKHEPDFEASRVSIWRTTSDGKNRVLFRSEKVVHYRDDASSTYVKPYVLMTSSTQEIKIHALTASVFNEGEKIELNGDVNMVRNQAGKSPITLNSEHIALLPDTQKASSRTASEFRQGQQVLRAAGGFDYQHNPTEIVFFGPVHSMFLGKSK